jgi:hypothetical protein
MKYLIELDSKEMDTFLDIFYAGVTLPVSSQSNTEKGIIRKINEIGMTYEVRLAKR